MCGLFMRCRLFLEDALTRFGVGVCIAGFVGIKKNHERNQKLAEGWIHQDPHITHEVKERKSVRKTFANYYH